MLTLAVIGIAAHAATETSWTYQSYDVRSGDKAVPGYITLNENGGAATLHIMAGNMNRCFSRDLNVTVERTADKTIIVAEPFLMGCDKLRYTLKNDGTGGTREVWAVDKWELDPKDRVLTLRK